MPIHTFNGRIKEIGVKGFSKTIMADPKQFQYMLSYFSSSIYSIERSKMVTETEPQTS
jgi:hypothetical protein